MTEVCKEQYGAAPGPVERWRLRSGAVSVEILSLGCVIKSVSTPDPRQMWPQSVQKERKKEKGEESIMIRRVGPLNIVVAKGYLSNPRYFGAVVGRVANRIAKGRFVVDEKEYELAINNGPNALHGGLKGFAVWTTEAVDNGVKLSHFSPDGDEGYPGNLNASVTYRLEKNTLSVLYHAQTERTTPINHSYFNLAGQGTPDIYDHSVTRTCQIWFCYNVTGEVKPVEKTLFDLRKLVLLGSRLEELPGPGFDHNFCLCSPGEPPLERKCARVVHPGTGRVLEVSTTQPGVQFYTSNFLDGTLKGKGGAAYSKHSAFCLETQNWPDAVNQPHFPDALLRPGETYTHTTRFTFSVI
ncbi:aldose 1-epimerase-like [Sinocyclocheilus rhinocerous]|uniref:aldose 1-epimerase-like n=1 Tax=Sinocyclocheilus rhinocerous TaxID=307959 RepID=UPI0007BAA6DF|nr:PREDICTED: aldose 1-epimerase-like [Sinocyclocheilus rhinocerous]